jgi:hypothetical protein
MILQGSHQFSKPLPWGADLADRAAEATHDAKEWSNMYR